MIGKISLLCFVPIWSYGAHAESDGLTREQIQDTIQKNTGGVLSCYDNALIATPQLKGRIHLSFDIEQNGKVINAIVSQSTLNNKVTEDCVIENTKKWNFPKPIGIKPVHVDYPFEFRKLKKR